MAGHTSYEPLPRYGHAAVAVNNKLHMWGGSDGSERKSQELAQKLEVYVISTEQWQQKPTHGTPPPGLWYTAYAVVGSCLFVFGGWDAVFYQNSLYKLDLHTYQWEQVRVSNPSSGPNRKYGSGVVSYGDNELVVFAGFTGSVWRNELHVFDLNKGEYSLCTKPQAKQCYMVHVVQFISGVAVTPTKILSGYNQGYIDHKLDLIIPGIIVPPDFGDARQEGWH